MGKYFQVTLSYPVEAETSDEAWDKGNELLEVIRKSEKDGEQFGIVTDVEEG